MIPSMYGCRFPIFSVKPHWRSNRNDKVYNRRLIVDSPFVSRCSSCWPSKHGAGRTFKSRERNGKWHFRLRIVERSEKKGTSGEFSHSFRVLFSPTMNHRVMFISRFSREPCRGFFQAHWCLWCLHTLQMKTQSKRNENSLWKFCYGEKKLFFYSILA